MISHYEEHCVARFEQFHQPDKLTFRWNPILSLLRQIRFTYFLPSARWIIPAARKAACRVIPSYRRSLSASGAPTRSGVPLLQSNSTWRFVIHDPNPTAYDSIMFVFDSHLKIRIFYVVSVLEIRHFVNCPNITLTNLNASYYRT